VVGILTTQQKAQILVEKAVLLETHKYLTLFQDVFKTQRLFAVEPVAQVLLQVVLETVQPQAPLVGITVKPQQLPLVSVLETIFKAQQLKPLIITTATLLLHLLQQHTPVRLLWVLAAVQGLPLAQGLTATPAVRVAA
jgi:hypothetical protein